MNTTTPHRPYDTSNPWVGDEPFEVDCDACGATYLVTAKNKTHKAYIYDAQCPECGARGYVVSVPDWAPRRAR